MELRYRNARLYAPQGYTFRVNYNIDLGRTHATVGNPAFGAAATVVSVPPPAALQGCKFLQPWSDRTLLFCL